MVGDSGGWKGERPGFDGERRSRTAGWGVMRPWRHSLGSPGDLGVAGWGGGGELCGRLLETGVKAGPVP